MPDDGHLNKEAYATSIIFIVIAVKTLLYKLTISLFILMKTQFYGN